MLPSTDSEIPDTMQTGELEHAAPEEAPPHASMTITKTSPQTQNILQAPLVAVNPAEFKYKQENDATGSTTSSDAEADVSDGEPTAPYTKSYPQSPSNVRQIVPHQPPVLEAPTTPEQTNESVRSWLQRITAMQQEIQKKQQTNNNSLTTNLGGFQQQPPSKIVKYQDLPYMGEMTLDNSKPRRGRKPKKADICHLIYKNYGTIFPGTPKNLVDSQSEVKKTQGKSVKEQPIPDQVQRTNVQNKIISSLLEKRLTQESFRNKELLFNTRLLENEFNSQKVNVDQNEPLNLCIRDLNQLKIRLLRKQGNTYSSNNDVKSEPPSEDDDVEFVDEISSPDSIRLPLSSELDRINPIPDLKPIVSPGSNLEGASPGGYVYWPNAGVFIHPMALHSQLMYYQRLASNNNLPRSGETPPSPLLESPPITGKEFRKLIPKHLAQTASNHTTSPSSTDESTELSLTPVNTQESRVKRGATQSGNAPTKRKRSAIFIPPIPAENQTNPATEVSICKFKFTGGAKPSLQEKKMLSVDSGGNFRYYSGTGDKSMRGYEFFPRETLQQQAAAGSSHGSGTGAFLQLQASGEKHPMLPPQSDQKTLPPEFMFCGEAPLQPLPAISPDLSAASQRHRKRKTRKSLQREKLEQTFKEKGFLIQTQQLESAEGATYCKFRQLRKFTRYLFRSWKDYLPGNVRELQENERPDEDDVLDSNAGKTSPITDNLL